jgi:hypothetical protein
MYLTSRGDRTVSAITISVTPKKAYKLTFDYWIYDSSADIPFLPYPEQAQKVL